MFLAWFFSLPKAARIALVAIPTALAIWGAVSLYIGHREREAVEADRTAANAETLAKDAKADDAAQDAATGVVDGVEAGNAAALKAAEGSDDPLGDALRTLPVTD